MTPYILLKNKRPHVNQRCDCVVETISGQPHQEYLYLRQLGESLYWDENPESSKDFCSVYSFDEVSYWRTPDLMPFRPIGFR